MKKKTLHLNQNTLSLRKTKRQYLTSDVISRRHFFVVFDTFESRKISFAQC